MTSITFNTFDLQSSSIVTTEIQQFESSMRSLNMQKFSTEDGAKILSTSYEPKRILLGGYLKQGSKSSLEEAVDELKKELLNPQQADLDVEYTTGTRRFVATCESVNIPRSNWNIDYIEWTAEFVISDPPFGKSTTSTTLHDGISNTYSSTSTGEHTGNITHAGTVAPANIIRFTFNSTNSVRKVKFRLTNSNNFTTSTDVTENFNDDDVLEINVADGQVTKNGSYVDFDGGFPNFTLSGNTYTISVVAKAYDIDVKFVYTPIWL